MHDVPRRMPFPADPAKTPDSLVVLAWNWFTLRMGIDPLVTLRPLNRRGWDDYSPRSGNPMPAKRFVRAFCESFAQCGISAIIAARREDPGAHLRACVARTHRVRNKFWQRPVRYQPARCGVHKRLPPGFCIITSVGWKKVTHRPALVPDRIRHETVTLNFCRSTSLRLVASEECGILLLRGGIFDSGNCQAPAARRRSCAHRCHSELAILRLARLRYCRRV
jgi:hypothetical protein